MKKILLIVTSLLITLVSSSQYATASPAGVRAYQSPSGQVKNQVSFYGNGSPQKFNCKVTVGITGACFILTAGTNKTLVQDLYVGNNQPFQAWREVTLKAGQQYVLQAEIAKGPNTGEFVAATISDY